MRFLTTILLFSSILAGGFSANFIFAGNVSDVVINEIAWMGTDVSYNDEWIVVIK